MVVDEREQVGLAASDVRAVQRVAGPQIVGAVASKRPKASAVPRRRPVFNPKRAKWRCRVRAPTVPTRPRPMIWATCAAVRRGASRLSASASANTSAAVRVGSTAHRRGERLETPRPPGPDPPVATSAPATRTRRPSGPACSAPPGRAPAAPARLPTARGRPALRIMPSAELCRVVAQRVTVDLLTTLAARRTLGIIHGARPRFVLSG